MNKMPYIIVLVLLTVVIVFASPESASANSLIITNTSSSPSLGDVENWAVKKMLSWSRPGRSLHPPAQETYEDGMARYAEIANAVRDVVYDPDERVVFGGRYGRARTMALLLAISMFESGYRKDVDLNIGKLARGDGGRSWCLMQIQLGAPIMVDSNGKRAYGDTLDGAKESTPTRIVFNDDGSLTFTSDQTIGVGGPELIADRRNCFRAGLRAVRMSFRACRKLPTPERLSAYASGNCDDGREASKSRVGAAFRWVSSNRPPMKDADVQTLLDTINLPPKTPSTSIMPDVVAIR